MAVTRQLYDDYLKPTWRHIRDRTCADVDKQLNHEKRWLKVVGERFQTRMNVGVTAPLAAAVSIAAPFGRDSVDCRAL